MTESQISTLVHMASKLGAQGIRVLGWKPPESATSDPLGLLIVDHPVQDSGSRLPWYMEKD